MNLVCRLDIACAALKKNATSPPLAVNLPIFEVPMLAGMQMVHSTRSLDVWSSRLSKVTVSYGLSDLELGGMF